MHKITCLADVEKLETAEPSLPSNTYELFSESANSFSDQVAIQFMPDSSAPEKILRYNYTELHAKITQTANAFYQLGVRKQDVVSFLLPNLPQTHFVLWGASAIGITNPINPLLEPENMIAIMNAAQSKVLVVMASPDPAFRAKISILIEKVPTLTAILFIGGDLTHWPATQKVSFFDFDQYIALQASDHLDFDIAQHENDIACYLHTGGTTGTPKLAMLSHGNLIHAAWCVYVMLHFEEKDVVLACLPLFHVFAIIGCGLAVFLKGANILMASPKGFRDEQVIHSIWKIVAMHQVNVFIAVPTVFHVISTVPVSPYDIRCVKYAVCGSSPLPIQTIVNFEKHTGITMLEGYGMTESACIISVNTRYGDRKMGSVGLRIPFQRIKAVIMDESGNYLRDCAVDELGHLLVKGANIFKGYKGASQSSIRDGWFDTGDLGFIDQSGTIWIRGRSKDLIIRGGHNIDPLMIEEALYQHPSVLAAAAVGKPCSKAGELPVAYVSLHEKNSVDEATLLDFISQKIGERAAIPKNIYIIDAIPVTAVGKIYKPALRLDAVKRVLTEQLTPLAQGVPFDITTALHPSHGQCATIHFKDVMHEKLKAEIYQQLEHFNIKAELVF